MASEPIGVWDAEDYFGHCIAIKPSDTLRIGYQNIGGFSFQSNSAKDDIIRRGITMGEFDIFGFGEVNVDWRLLSEENRLFLRTKSWWDTLHISLAHNITDTPFQRKQFGGVALFSLGKTAHRVLQKGQDTTMLGRWTWTLFRGRDSQSLKIYSAYRPNPPSGPYSVYSQQRQFFLSKAVDRWPRKAFLEDLCQDLKKSMGEGQHVVVLLDGNEDMRNSDVSAMFGSLPLREVILECHGNHTPSTYKRNLTCTPIDGIWASYGINISSGGYFPFDQVFLGTDHRCLWIDVSFISAFGHTMPNIVKPKARRLHCKDPRLIDNFNNKLQKLFLSHDLLSRFQALQLGTSYPAPPSFQEEFNQLNWIRHLCVQEAERTCRKLRMGQVAFSPQIQLLRVQWYAWELLLKRSRGLRVSSRLLARTLKKANLDPSVRTLTTEEYARKTKDAFQMYYKTRASAPELRQKHLDQLAEAWAIVEDTSKEKMLRILKQREQSRLSHRKIKYLRGKMEKNSTTIVTILDDDLNRVDLTNRHEIEAAILHENAAKFTQSFSTPFFVDPLVSDFGFKATTVASQQVLSGNYIPPSDISETLKKYLSHLATPTKVLSGQPQDFSISLADHQKFWRRAKEDTACFPGALSFATMKAGAKNSFIAEIDCMAANIPMKGGFAPTAWQHCTDVMIPKKSGVTLLSGLRTIVLFPVDCNYVFKFIGREMMRNAESAKALAPEQYGSRKLHKAIDLAACKSLTYDLIRQLRRPGALCCNDAKSCYDLIGHAQASLSMQRLGVPTSAADCMFSTLQLAKHQVRTSYGDSSSFYQGSTFCKPLHGIGQGNGAGPAIWAVVSSPILDIMRSADFGAQFTCPLTLDNIAFVGYAYVDDTDLVVCKPSYKSYSSAAKDFQASMILWEEGLKATGGAIVPEKTYTYVIDFKWKNGLWSYCSKVDTPATFAVKDISNVSRPVQRFEVWQAQETLGAFLAPDGNLLEQYNKMLSLVKKWADNMRTGRISIGEVWLALTTTIWRSLCYPLAAINLTKTQCNKIMAPLLNYALPAMGICQNFPRDIVFAPTTYMGLGIKHLYTTQEITRLKDILLHSMQKTLLGSLYRISLTHLILEIGLSTPLHAIPFDKLGFLVTPSLIKSSWEFLFSYNIELRHDLIMRPPRQLDRPLMEVFLSTHNTKEQLGSLNRCRLFLHAFWLSDIVDGSGSFILEDAWIGNEMHPDRKISWPRSPKPKHSDWKVWQEFLSRTVILRGRRLRQTLSLWHTDSSIPWLYSPTDESLYHVAHQLCWRHAKIPRLSGLPRFFLEGTPSTLPEQIHPATVYKRGSCWVITGFGDFEPPIRPAPDFESHLTTLSSRQGFWSIQHIWSGANFTDIVTSVQDGSLIAVSDGSFKDSYGTAAWILHTPSTRCVGQVIVPGSPSDHNSYRSEVAGLFSILLIVDILVNYFQIKQGSLVIACDGVSALDKIFSYVSIVTVDDPCYDLLSVAQLLWKNSPLLWKAQHVKGHQDDHRPIHELDTTARLNIEMDKLAKQFIEVAKRSPRHYITVHEPWSLWMDGEKVVQNVEQAVYDRVHTPPAKHYWGEKKQLSPVVIDDVNWPAMQKALASAPLSRKIFVMKHTVGMCGVGKFMVRWRQRSSPACPRCGEDEDATHVLRCRGMDTDVQWDKSIQNLHAWLLAKDTDPDLIRLLVDLLTSWRLDTPLNDTIPYGLSLLSERQQDIGGEALLHGWLSYEWESCQQAYLNFLKSKRTGKRWVIQLIRKLWNISWDLWEHRNGILHQTEQNYISRLTIIQISSDIQSIYGNLQGIIPPADRYLLSLPLPALLKKDQDYQRLWLAQATLVLNSIRQAVREAERKRQQDILQMRLRLRSWLQLR